MPVNVTAMTGSAMPPGHPDIAGGAGDATAAPLVWTTPAGWTEMPVTELRVGSFKINQAGKIADVSVIPLPGTAGTDAANVNRWRGQVGLPVLSADNLQKTSEPIEISGQSAQLYDIAGVNPASGDTTRITAAIEHRADVTWFFKMTGDADLVEQQKPAFLAFLKSLKFSGTAAHAEMPSMSSGLPPNHPAIGDMTAPAGPISHEGQPQWQVPSGWQEVSGGQFLVAKFILTGNAGAQASVNVSSSGGDGGGLVANVTRWRGQLGLPPADDFSATQLEVNGGKGQQVDLEGTNPQTGKPAKLVAVMASQGGQTWFYKLMGDAAVVDAQKNAFIKFAQGAKY